MIIRPATTTDAPALAAILGALVETTTIEWTDTPHTPERVLDWMDAHHVVLVAENDASIAFHERLGFVEVARMPEIGTKFGRWCSLVLLQRHLDDRADPDAVP